MRSFAITALLLLVAGCGDKRCAKGTLFIDITRIGAGLQADTLLVSASVGGGPTQTGSTSLAKAGAATSIAIELGDGYPAGQVLSLTLSGTKNGVVVALVTAMHTLAPSCDRIDLALAGLSSDAGVMPDGPDMPDFANCTPTVTTCPSTMCGAIDNGCGGSVMCAVPCQVSQVTPRLAQTGTTVVVDGVFNPGTVVNFPGGAKAALTLTGANRGTVTVPATATAGALSVTSGVQVVDAGTFRRASFTLAPRAPDIFYPQLDVARHHTQLSSLHAHATLVATDDWIYVLGGATASDGNSMPSNVVERVRVNADGTLGFHETLPVKLTTARFAHAALIIGKTIYVIGGTDGTKALASIESATINADGTLTAFTTSASLLMSARSYATASVVGSSLYVVGGTTGTTELGSVEVAPILADGSLGAFTGAGAITLATSRHGQAAFITPTALVVVGGETGTTPLNTVESAPITGGVLGSFATVPSTLPTSNFQASLSGVQFGSTLLAWPYVSQIASDGSMGTFGDSGLTLPNDAYAQELSAVVARDHLYLLTGIFIESGPPVQFNLLASAPLIQRADTAGFSISTTTALPAGRGNPGGVVLGNNAYVIGGGATGGASSTIYVAPIAADDTLGAFKDSGVTLPAPRDQFALAVVDQTLYVLGGIDDKGMMQSTVLSLAVAADGTLSQPTTVKNVMLTVARDGLRAVSMGDLVCAVGGNEMTGTFSAQLECAAVASGSISSTFTATAGASLKTPRAWHNIVQQESYIYVMGGAATTTTEKDYYAPGVGSFQAWSPATPMLDTPRSYAAGMAIGPTWFLFGGQGTTSTTTIDGDTFDTNFTVDANAVLMEAVQGPTALLIGNLVYVIGGNTTTGAVTSVEVSGLQ